MPINCFHFWHRLSAFSRTFVDLGDIFPNCWKIASATSADVLRQLSTNGNEASFSKIQKQKACCCRRMIDQLVTMQLLTFEKYSSLIYHVCNLNTLDWCDHTIHKTPFAELDTLHILKITWYPQNHSIFSKSRDILKITPPSSRVQEKIEENMKNDVLQNLHIFDSPKKLNFGIDGW